MAKINKIPQVSGANIMVEDMEKPSVAITKLVVNVDDTSDSVIELIEELERVELIYPPGIFVYLDLNKVKDKLTAQSIEKYFIAKLDFEATEREEKAKEKDPSRGKIKITGGSVSHKMAFTKKEKEWAKKNNKHLAILNGYEQESAVESGYQKIPGSSVIKNFIPKARVDEELYKVGVDKDAYKEYMQSNSNKSKGKIKSFETETKDNSEVEGRKKLEDVEIKHGRERTPVYKD